MQAAYNDAVSEAAHDRGHGCYTGTIGRDRRRHVGRVLADDRPRCVVLRRPRHTQLREVGPARAIPVAADSDPR